MRTTQYSFLLAVQVVLLCVLFAVGGKTVDALVDRASVPDGTHGERLPADHGTDELRGYLSR